MTTFGLQYTMERSHRLHKKSRDKARVNWLNYTTYGNHEAAAEAFRCMIREAHKMSLLEEHIAPDTEDDVHSR